MNQKQKGYVGLGAMAVLAAVTVLGSNPIYGAIDNFGKKPVSYNPGSYTGAEEGFGGKIFATVTVSDKEILSVELKGDDETPGLGTRALDELPAVILDKQTARVDAIAGATVTSEAVLSAVGDCLSQAGQIPGH